MQDLPWRAHRQRLSSIGMINVIARNEGGALVQAVCPVCNRTIEQVIGIPEGTTVEGRLVVASATHVGKECRSFLVLDFPELPEKPLAAGAGITHDAPLSA